MVLNSPIEIYGLTAKNRVVLQPMEGCDGTLNGSIGELTERRYLRFAKSGAGIIWFEATATSEECRANPHQLYLHEQNVGDYQRLLTQIRETAQKECGFTPLLILQSTNSGRWSKPNGTPAPIVAYRNSLWEQGKEAWDYTLATDEYLSEIPLKYEKAARLAVQAGFDGIDVKCCHGYLMNELLSAYQRPGQYGGSLENRTRLYFDCIKAAQKGAEGKIFVTTRFNACDCFDYPYGYGVNKKNEIDLTETKIILKKLSEMGIELVNLTLGNPYLIPHINRPCKESPEELTVGLSRIYSVTKELQQEFKQIKFVMSGLSYQKKNALAYAERCLQEGVTSFAGFGRMSFCYPEFFRDYLQNGTLNAQKTCLGCAKCTQLMRNKSGTGCPVRDAEVYLPLYRKYVLKQ